MLHLMRFFGNFSAHMAPVMNFRATSRDPDVWERVKERTKRAIK
jgi:hypothetical protein